MIYKNAKDVLPRDVLRQLQKYAEGDILYIPRRDNSRAGWGEKSGIRKQIQRRNSEIVSLYHQGWCIKSLALKYFLTESSIRKVVTGCGKKEGRQVI